MNHKQMLDKMRELEARIKQLEQRAHFHAPQPIVPQPAVPQPPWVVTCSNPQDAFEIGTHQEQQTFDKNRNYKYESYNRTTHNVDRSLSDC